MNAQIQSEPLWPRIDKYAIQSPCGNFTIACVMLSGTWMFELWKIEERRAVRIDGFGTLEAAKAHWGRL